MINLNGQWTLYITDDKTYQLEKTELRTEKDLIKCGFECVDAAVPGNYELDLQRAGLLPDLFFGENALLAQEYEDHHLWYVNRFRYDGFKDNIWLHFDGIDTFSEVYLNGIHIGSTDNMLIAYEFLADCLLRGENELVVHIRPAALEARKMTLEAGAAVFLPYNADSLAVRKAAHMYGWDIMPRILSGGLWRSVYLAEKLENRIDDLYLYTAKADAGSAEVWAYYRLAVTNAKIRDYALRISGRCRDNAFSKTVMLWHTEGQEIIHIENPRLWWPRDMGGQNLYEISAELFFKGKVLDKKTLRFGIRTVQLQRTSLTNTTGSGEFCFFVNEEPFFVRGTNWVPLDAFHSRDKERLPKALNLLEDIGCNMVRCWGGNVYEDSNFFDFCDERGIAVWQDFGMCCATYPQHEAFCASIQREAEHIVKKLRRHPSLILWSGDNECDSAAAEWTQLKLDPNQNRLTREIIPDVLQRLDPTRPYLPSSPYIDKRAWQSEQFEMLPEYHLWGLRDYFKSSYYQNSPAHFASEVGYYGCPSPESMKKFLSSERMWPWEENPEWHVHASCMETEESKYSFRIPLMAGQVKTFFGHVPEALDEFAMASQISQAEADKFFIERFRAGKWRRTGIIWWNLLDGWPQFSDAVVDYYFTKKLAYHYIKRSQAPVCLMFAEPSGGRLSLMGVNEHLFGKDVSFLVTDLSSGEVTISVQTVLEKNSVTELAQMPFHENEHHFFLIEWTVSGQKNKNHYLSGKPPYSLQQYIQWIKQAEFYHFEGFPKQK